MVLPRITMSKPWYYHYHTRFRLPLVTSYGESRSPAAAQVDMRMRCQHYNHPYLQSRPTIKRTGENGDTVFLAPAATPTSSLTAGNAKKCGLMYSTLYTGSFHAHAIHVPHWNTCRNLRSFLRCSARSAFAHSASA